MYLIVTRSYPPELGGMQSLMWGFTREMSKNFLIKVFADYQKGHEEFDAKVNFSIERVGGIKFLDISLVKPHIKLCMPPNSGGKALVIIKYINYCFHLIPQPALGI